MRETAGFSATRVGRPGTGAGPLTWTLRDDTRAATVRLVPVARSNNVGLLAALVGLGLGLAMLPDWVASGVPGIVPVLPHWTQLGGDKQPALFALYPEDAGKARLRGAFVITLREVARQGPQPR